MIAAAAAVPAIAGVNNINYQAVLKDGNGVMADKKVEMKFELLDKSDNVVYTEEQAPTTSATGMVVCQLGKDDELSTIEWGDLTLRVSMKVGSSYEVISNEAVSSVPTAIYALKSADSDMIIEAVEELQQETELNKETIIGINAEIVKLNGLSDDFENLNENLTNSFNELDTKFEEVNGQIENLNNVAAVTRQNEERLDALDESLDSAFTMTENRLDAIMTLIEGQAGDFESMGENLTNSFTSVNAEIEEIYG